MLLSMEIEGAKRQHNAESGWQTQIGQYEQAYQSDIII